MAADYIPGADGEFDAWQANFACLPSAAEVEARHLKQRPPGLSEPANAVDLSGHYFWGWSWRRIRRELVAVLVESRGENRYNSCMKRATRHAGCG